MNVLTLLLLAAFAATVVSLVGGVASMVGRGEAAHHSSEHWMVMRVSFQALAIVLLLIAVVGTMR